MLNSFQLYHVTKSTKSFVIPAGTNNKLTTARLAVGDRFGAGPKAWEQYKPSANNNLLQNLIFVMILWIKHRYVPTPERTSMTRSTTATTPTRGRVVVLGNYKVENYPHPALAVRVLVFVEARELPTLQRLKLRRCLQVLARLRSRRGR